MPPTMPRRALDVLAAMSSPPGTENVTASGASVTSARAAGIMRRGTGLMAGVPTARPRPGLVTVPTPAPATSDGGAGLGHLGGHAGAVGAVGVVAGVLDHDAAVRRLGLDGEGHPPAAGQPDLDLGRGVPVTRPMAAALAAALAHVPVVHPVRSPPAGAHAGRPAVVPGRDRRRNMWAKPGE